MRELISEHRSIAAMAPRNKQVYDVDRLRLASFPASQGFSDDDPWVVSPAMNCPTFAVLFKDDSEAVHRFIRACRSQLRKSFDNCKIWMKITEIVGHSDCLPDGPIIRKLLARKPPSKCAELLACICPFSKSGRKT